MIEHAHSNANGIAGPNIQCTGSQICARIEQPSADSSIISQGIENSPKLTALEKQPSESHELTATEKITKLKSQYVELYQ